MMLQTPTDWIHNKIKTSEELAFLCHSWRVTGRQIVFTNGCFDILHRGHLQYLAEAKAQGNKLVVGVNSDASVKRLKGNDRPIHGEEDRLFQLASLLVVDAVILFEEDTPKQLIELVKPDVLAKGGDYQVENIVGADFVIQSGGRVAILPFVAGHSTTGIVEKLKK